MAFLIPDNLKSRPDVPSHIRRVADAFQLGLDESATLWYEPLYDLHGERPHFVLLVPDRGIVVFEVVRSYAEDVLGTLRGKMHLKVDGVERELDSPMDRAIALASVLRERLKAEPRLAGVPVAAGAVLSGLTKEQAGRRKLDKALDLDLCIFSDEISAAVKGEGEGILRRAITRMLDGDECSLDDEHLSLIRSIIQPETVIGRMSVRRPDKVQLQLFTPSEAGDVIRVMDRQQEALAKSLGGGHRVIRGVAGSGKTLILVFRARLLARSQPRKTFLVTCYGRALAGQLRDLLADSPNVEVENIDRVMKRVVDAAGMEWPGYSDDGVSVWKAALSALKQGPVTKYDGVLIDEGQDFSTEMLQFAVGLLCDPEAGDLVVVADAAQNIYRRKFNWRAAGIQAQGRTRILRTNYRNTKQILEFAYSFLISGDGVTTGDAPDWDNENEVIPPESASREGEPPTVHLVDGAGDEVSVVVNQVIEWAADDGDDRIAVIHSGAASWPSSIRDALEAGGLDVFWLTDSNDKQARDHLAASDADVVLSTVESAKGLEFPRVVLCNLWSGYDDDAVNRRMAYVGMTRAQNHLSVVHGAAGPLSEDLKEASELVGD
jgi:hypothetical protein